MAAAVVVTPTEVQVGDLVVIQGTGFLSNTVCDVSIPEYGYDVQITSDPDGSVNSDDLADYAVGLLTSDAVQVTAADTVTIDSVVYIFRASVTTTAGDVKIGSDAAGSLANLKKAINLTGVGGTDYGSSTVIHPTVTAGALTATTLQLYAKARGTAGNSLTTTEGSTHLSFGASTLLTGAAAGTKNPLHFTPQKLGPFTVKINDGVSTAQVTVPVWTE